MITPELIVLNLNKNFTGVSATTAGVIKKQVQHFQMCLLGYPLDEFPNPISKKTAYELCENRPRNRPFSIWHVRRNPEMRIALWARDILKLPIKIVFTSAAQRYHSLYPRWLISKMDAVIATTPEAAKYVSNVYATVPHGVDTEKYQPAENRSKSWKALGYGGKRGVATIGRIRPEKGTDIFVETMLQVLPKYPDLVALIIGKTAIKHKKFQVILEERIRQAGLSSRLLFIGEVSPQKMPLLIRSLSLLIALPRYEGYGMTPLEALASGVPFVGSDTGYFKEFSNKGTVGTVVPCEDNDLAKDAIDSFLSNPDKLAQASNLAVKFVTKHHSIEKEVEGITNVYNMLWSETNAINSKV